MFRTELTITPASRQLPRTARVLTLGSCFADSIGARLALNKVETLVNPFGTVFQPLALAQLLRAATGDEVDWQQHLVEARGRWQSYDLHGSIGAATPVDLLQTIQQLVQRTADFVRSADLVVLTLGTAWAYRLRETGELVSNCHKMTPELFVKELLTPDEIINALAETHAYLRRINPEVEIVLTVSPVRHLKDTLPLNAVSKSVLRVACHYLSDLLKGVSYFPAFELLTDDLRDYRFYAADMLHPSEVAEDYIWDKFARAYFDVDFGRFRKEWAAIRQSLGHRPLHEGAPAHRQFLENTLERLQKLASQQVPVAEELSELEQRVAALPVPPPPPAEPDPEEDDEERIDIGASTADAETAEAPVPLPVPAAGRPERLSPEEFRRQRAERERRHKEERRHNRQAHENQAAQPAPASEHATPGLLTRQTDAELTTNEEFASASEVLGLNSAPTAISTAEPIPGLEPLKKKKRRSRGGAKRTARKHAARQAAEAGEEAAIAALVPPAETPEAAIPAEPAHIAGVAPLLSGTVPESDNTGPAVVLPEVPAVAPVPAAAPTLPEEPRKGKKSSVITKSTPIKRGSRRAASPRSTDPQPAPLPITGDSVLPEVPEVVEAAPNAAVVIPDLPTPLPAEAVAATLPAAKKKRSRGRKEGGRAQADASAGPSAAPSVEPAVSAAEAPEQAAAAPASDAGKPRPKGPKRQALYKTPAPEPISQEPAPAPVPTEAEQPSPKPTRQRPKKGATAPGPASAETPAIAPEQATGKPRRKPAKQSDPAQPKEEPAKPAAKPKAKPKATETKPKAPRNATKKS